MIREAGFRVSKIYQKYSIRAFFWRRVLTYGNRYEHPDTGDSNIVQFWLDTIPDLFIEIFKAYQNHADVLKQYYPLSTDFIWDEQASSSIIDTSNSNNITDSISSMSLDQIRPFSGLPSPFESSKPIHQVKANHSKRSILDDINDALHLKTKPPNLPKSSENGLSWLNSFKQLNNCPEAKFSEPDEITGKNNEKLYQIHCEFRGRKTMGIAPSKQKSKQSAAEKMKQLFLCHDHDPIIYINEVNKFFQRCRHRTKNDAGFKFLEKSREALRKKGRKETVYWVKLTYWLNDNGDIIKGSYVSREFDTIQKAKIDAAKGVLPTLRNSLIYS